MQVLYKPNNVERIALEQQPEAILFREGVPLKCLWLQKFPTGSQLHSLPLLHNTFRSSVLTKEH